MRSVQHRPIKEYFFKDKSVQHFASDLPLLFRFEHLINPLSTVVFILGLCLIGGFYSRLSLSFGISLLAMLAIIFYHTKSVAENIYIKRHRQKETMFEFEEQELVYTIVNASLFGVSQIWVRDKCSVSKQEFLSFDINQGLSGNTRKIIRKKVKSDSGMGIKQLGPVTLYISDSFGLFEFRIAEDSYYEVKVLPKSEELPDFRLQGSSHSDVYGTYSQNSQGNSINFIGVREYSYGDSLRHIAWNLSAKRSELLVKEFEKVSNAEVSIILNLSGHGHVGNRESSTWETSKDIALSLVSQQAKCQNSVSLFSQNFFVKNCGSTRGLNLLIDKLVGHDPLSEKESMSKTSCEDLLKKYFMFLKPGSNLFFVTPFLSQEAPDLIHQLKSLRQKGVQCFCVFIDTMNFQSALSRKMEFSEQFVAPAAVGIEPAMEQLQLSGVSCVVVRSGKSISQSFSNMRSAV